MKKIHLKVTIAAVTVSVAAAALGLSALSDGWVYYLPVDQFVSDSAYHGQRVRLHGIVGEDRLEVSPGLLTASFDLRGEVSHLPVIYRGVVPDQFQASREVVVEGTLDEHGVLQADTLLTKCASKYEQGEAPHADPRMTHGEAAE